MHDRTFRRKEAQLPTEIVAATIGTCSVLLLSVIVAISASAMIAFLVWIAFAVSGAQRLFFSMLARTLRRIVKSREPSGQEDMGHTRGKFKVRRPVPLVIEHDPDEFSRKRA